MLSQFLRRRSSSSVLVVVLHAHAIKCIFEVPAGVYEVVEKESSQWPVLRLRV